MKQGVVKLSRQRLWQLEHIKQGLCINCSQPVHEGTQLCARHQRSRSRRPRWTEEMRRRFCSLWNDPSLDIWQIAKEINRSTQNVRAMARFLRKKGYTLRMR